MIVNNLGLHVGDNDSTHVLKNRQQLTELLHYPVNPYGLNKHIVTTCVIAEEDSQ